MQRKGTRPSRHIRRIRVGRRRRFKRAVVINPHINKIIVKSSQKKDIDLFKNIAQKARAKGYNIPPIDVKHGPISVANDPIPEGFFIDAFTMPVEDALSAWDSKFARQKGKGKYYIGVDDDASHSNRVRGFSHELGHVHLVQTNTKPHTEAKADKIGADILDMPIQEFRKDIVFDQNFFKAGIQLPRKIPKKLLESAKKEQMQNVVKKF